MVTYKLLAQNFTKSDDIFLLDNVKLRKYLQELKNFWKEITYRPQRKQKKVNSCIIANEFNG